MKETEVHFHLLIQLLNQILPTGYSLNAEGGQITTRLDGRYLAMFDFPVIGPKTQEIEDILNMFLSDVQHQVAEHTGVWWPSGRTDFPDLTAKLVNGRLQLLLSNSVLLESRA